MVQQEIRGVFSIGGHTLAKYTPKRDKLLVAGSNGIIKIFKPDEEDSEPDAVDVLDEISDFDVSPSGESFAVSSKTGEVELYSLIDKDFKKKIIRSGLPIRNVLFIHNGERLIASGDDEEVQIVDLKDTSNIVKFKVPDQVHDLSYDAKFNYLSLSLSNGDVLIYSTSSEVPKLIHTLSDEINALIYQDDDESSEDDLLTAKLAWNGDLFCFPTKTNIIKVFSSREGFKLSQTFVKLHNTGIVDLQWSTKGEFIASIDLNNKLIVWDSKTREPVVNESLNHKALNLSWRLNKDAYDLAIGSDNGDVLYFPRIVEKPIERTEEPSALNKLLQEEPDEEEDEDADGSADEINLNSDVSGDDGDNGEDLRDFVDDDGFIDDDDGNGYTGIPQKRPIDDYDEDDLGDGIGANGDRPRHIRPDSKRVTFQPRTTAYNFQPYSPGCTPYVSDRRYLTINSIGYVTSVKQEGKYSITVSFFDESVHREYNFEDLYGYDLAGLTKEGLLLGCSGQNSSARIYFRSHMNNSESWEKIVSTKSREIVTSISINDEHIIICTSFGYMRQYDQHGTIESILKINPIIAACSNENYIFTICLNNQQSLLYNLQDSQGNFIQRDSSLPLETKENLIRGIFFSSYGDPVLIDDDGIVMVLSRWRTPLQSRWIPILDSDERIKQVGGKGDLRIWPLGLHGEKLNCIIIRGSIYPNYPLSLPSELDVRIPINDKEQEEDAEEELIRSKTLGELLGEMLSTEGEKFEDDEEKLNEYAILFDRALLKLIMLACSESKTAKAWKLIQGLKQDKALMAASKIAERVGLVALVNRINQLREQRMELE